MILTFILALLGSASAQYHLGDYYWQRHQYDVAIKWLYHSAEQGNDAAGKQWVQSVFYLSKQWDVHNPMATDWRHLIMMQAQAGDPPAQFQMGLMYQYGQTYANMRKALFWYQKSAASYYPAALLKLGFVYDKGLGVRHNPWLARHYFFLGESYEHYK